MPRRHTLLLRSFVRALAAVAALLTVLPAADPLGHRGPAALEFESESGAAAEGGACDCSGTTSETAGAVPKPVLPAAPPWRTPRLHGAIAREAMALKFPGTPARRPGRAGRDGEYRVACDLRNGFGSPLLC
ncbi:MAG: hypothetical protein U1A27_10565 [Phycisphaerae bacterium]